MFNDIEITPKKVKPSDWDIDMVMASIKVCFTVLKSDPKLMQVRASICGLTLIKLSEHKHTILVPVGAITKDQVIERLSENLDVVWEARTRYVIALNKAKITREKNRC